MIFGADTCMQSTSLSSPPFALNVSFSIVLLSIHTNFIVFQFTPIATPQRERETVEASFDECLSLQNIYRIARWMFVRREGKMRVLGCLFDNL